MVIIESTLWILIENIGTMGINFYEAKSESKIVQRILPDKKPDLLNGQCTALFICRKELNT
jgi:hypothetical protein